MAGPAAEAAVRAHDLLVRRVLPHRLSAPGDGLDTHRAARPERPADHRVLLPLEETQKAGGATTTRGAAPDRGAT